MFAGDFYFIKQTTTKNNQKKHKKKHKKTTKLDPWLFDKKIRQPARQGLDTSQIQNQKQKAKVSSLLKLCPDNKHVVALACSLVLFHLLHEARQHHIRWCFLIYSIGIAAVDAVHSLKSWAKSVGLTHSLKSWGKSVGGDQHRHLN